MKTLPEIGDPLPWATVTTTREAAMPLNGLAGHRVAVSFAGPGTNTAAIAAVLEAAASVLEAADAYWLIVTPRADDAPGIGNPRGRLVFDPDLALRRSCRITNGETGTVTVMTDPGLRIADVARHEGTDPLDQARAWLDGALMAEPAPAPALDAPVIMVPDVLEPALRQRLMQTWETDGHEASGYLRPEDDGSLVHVVNPGRKRRADHFLDDASPLAALVHDRVRRRVIPWIKRTTHFKIGFAERYRIACYEAESAGFFSAHRDFSEASPHRHFAMTICLNDGFEGGALRFPEFGMRAYRLAPGQAVVYSGSLLHEVTPITAGRRFALVNFLTNKEGARIVATYQDAHGTETRRKTVG